MRHPQVMEDMPLFDVVDAYRAALASNNPLDPMAFSRGAALDLQLSAAAQHLADGDWLDVIDSLVRCAWACLYACVYACVHAFERVCG
jgi:hypothetical protein